jgi:uncharacterized protein YbjQ (UPF0145 family)
MVANWEEVTVVTTQDIVGETINETYGYVSSTYLTWFFIFKGRTIERALDAAMSKIQYFAFRDGADAIVNVRTSLELQGQYLLYTRVSVFVEGTMVKLDES